MNGSSEVVDCVIVLGDCYLGPSASGGRVMRAGDGATHWLRCRMFEGDRDQQPTFRVRNLAGRETLGDYKDRDGKEE